MTTEHTDDSSTPVETTPTPKTRGSMGADRRFRAYLAAGVTAGAIAILGTAALASADDHDGRHGDRPADTRSETRSGHDAESHDAESHDEMGHDEMGYDEMGHHGKGRHDRGHHDRHHDGGVMDTHDEMHRHMGDAHGDQRDELRDEMHDDAGRSMGDPRDEDLDQ